MAQTIWCFVIGERATFSVIVDSAGSVDDLKTLIKTKKSANFDPTTLTLYLAAVDASMNKGMRMTELVQLSQNLDECTELDEEQQISESIGENPPGKKYYVLVWVPEPAVTLLAAAGDAAIERLNNSQSIDRNLFFTADHIGHRAFTTSLLVGNSIVDATAAVPPFLDEVRTRLKDKRSINAEQRGNLARTLRFNDFDPFFTSAEGDPDCSYYEIAHYGSLFYNRPSTLTMSKAIDQKGGGAMYYDYIGAFLCESYPNSTQASFSGEGTWPFSLVARVAGDGYSYTPRSDFLLLLKGCPFLIFEVCSDRTRELDRYRMLLQAGVLVRVMNSFKSNRGEFKSFIAVAIYINPNFTAERYLVGQPERGSIKITYTKDEFDLKTPTGAFRFFFELHNIPSALPHDGQLSDADSKLSKLLSKVRDATLPGFTSRPSKKRKSDEAGLDDSSAPETSTGIDGNPSLTRGLSELGIRFNSEKCPGWTILNPLPPNLHRGRTSDGKSVVLKLVKSRELEIHSFLSSIKSTENHTIPILHEVAHGTKAMVVMRDEVVLPFVAQSVFETSGDDLASQFLAGVRFMHQQNVAHLDLKPDNILVTPTTRPQLHICDYDVSVRVTGPESWITGYQGTPGWVAPEIKENECEPYRPIRADLWSTGCVMEYIASRHPAHTSLFKTLTKRLLNDDPSKRPLLHSVCLLDGEQPQLKRKASVQKGEVKRRRRHLGSQHVVQDPLALPLSL